ncbi:hypothetical protein ARTHRO9V_240109 [Arthrobacter sp. 9V]|nr:hypothetical protein ARTHRO9V_240109 [Arthrobacter sp. 9V]
MGLVSNGASAEAHLIDARTSTLVEVNSGEFDPSLRRFGNVAETSAPYADHNCHRTCPRTRSNHASFAP